MSDKFKIEKINYMYGEILSALKKTKFNRTKAAEVLGIDRKTIYNTIVQYEALDDKDKKHG